MKLRVDKNEDPVRVLSESEIQDRLYGAINGRRKAPLPEKTGEPVGQPAPAPEAPRRVERDWNGEEILTLELNRLRQDLISLREERERLAAELDRRVSAVERISRQPAEPWHKRWGRGLFAGFAILAAAAGIVGGSPGYRLLQASPTGGDPTPFTVQVAVYDSRSAADRGLAMLREIGYQAFVVDMPRLNGLPRYRLYVGSFVTKIEAEMELERLTRDPRFADAFVLLR